MRASFLAIVAIGLLGSLGGHPASAVTCRNGVYHAGCVSPNGAAVVRKQPTQPYAPNAVKPGTDCVNGPNRAGCVGPNGAAVVRKQPY